MTTRAEMDNRVEISRRFFSHAEEEFEAGDLPQASEKAWGAVAHYLKAEAKFRGWPNRRHADLSDTAIDLSYETAEPSRALDLYGTVEGLHQNFYEDWHSHLIVSRWIDNAKELIDMLESRNIPPLSGRLSQAGRRGRR